MAGAAASYKLAPGGTGGGGRRQRGRHGAAGCRGRALWGGLEDEHVMVVDKPAGVVVHPGAGRRHGTLAQALAGRAAGGPDPDRAGIVHRLDRDTSGLLDVAKSDEAYAALVEPDQGAPRATVSISPWSPATRTRRAGRSTLRSDATVTAARNVHRTDRPRTAVTHFEVLESLARTRCCGSARDRPHAPDPRTPRGDRPSGLRRRALRRRAMRPELGLRANSFTVRP